MARIPTVNVLVTLDYGVMKRFFIDGGSYRSLINLEQEILDRDDSFLFSNVGNANFLSLEHDIAKEKNVNAINVIKLEIIDPLREFENRFLRVKIPDLSRNNFSYAREVENTLEEKERTAKIAKATTQKAVKEGKDLARLLNPKGIDEARLEREIKESLERLRDKDRLAESLRNVNLNYELSQAEKDVLSNVRDSSTNRYVYIAYGVGNQLGDWAGPFVGQFINAQTNVNKGLRSTTLYFYAKHTHLLMNDLGNPSDLSYRGYGIRCYGQSKSLSQYLKQILPENANPNRYIRKGKNGFDAHSMLTDAFTQYLSKVTGDDNVLVFVPNINLICRKKILSALDKYKLLYYSDTNGHAIDKVFSLFGAMVGRPMGKNNLDALFGPDYIYVETMRSKLNKLKANSLDSEKLEDLYCRFIANPLSIEKDKNYPNYQKIVTDFINGLTTEASKELGDNYILYTENNIKVLEIWKKFGLIDRKSSSATVFTTDTFAKTFLYGMLTDASKEKTLGNAVKYVHPRDIDLTNDALLSEMSILTRLPRATLWGQQDQLPEDFDNLFGESLEELTKGADIPVFRHNIENPNVTKLNVNLDNIYFAKLQTTIDRISQFTTAQAFGLNLTPNLYNIDGNILGFIADSEVKQDKEDIQEKLTELFAEARGISLASAREYAELVMAMWKTNTENDASPELRIPEDNTTSPLAVLKRLYSDIYDFSREATLETLPMFHLSRLADLGNRSCILLSRQHKVIGVDPQALLLSPDETPILLDSFYSGVYRLMGMKHTISAKAVKSEFRLLKMSSSIIEKSESVSEQEKKPFTPVELPVFDALFNFFDS